MTIEGLGPQHVRAVAALHTASLGGLLTQLGSATLRAYYRACATSPLATAFVAVEGNAVTGFVLGSTSPASLRRDVLRRNTLEVALGVASGVLRRPTALWWLLRSVGGAGFRGYDVAAPELIYLAVSPTQRGRGIGRQLVDAFGDAVRAAGETRFELSVDENNRDAAAFYERLGFTRVGTYEEFGQRHIRYATTLSSIPDAKS